MLTALAITRLLNMSTTQLAHGLSMYPGRGLPQGLLNKHRSRSKRICTRTHASPTEPQTTSHSLDLSTVLSRVRQSCRGSNPLEEAGNKNAMASGIGKHMGCDVGWTTIWRPDGAFYEEIRSRHLTYKWGFDGGADSPVWEVDPSGVSKVLQCDDREATLIAALIKSGNWLLPDVAGKWLDLELEGDAADRRGPLVKQYKPEVSMPPVATLVLQRGIVAAAAAAEQTPAAAAAVSQSSGMCQADRVQSLSAQQQQQQPLLSRNQPDPSDHMHHPAAAAAAGEQQIIAAASLDPLDPSEWSDGSRFSLQDMTICHDIAKALGINVLFARPEVTVESNNDINNNISSCSQATDPVFSPSSKAPESLGALLLQQCIGSNPVDTSITQQQQQQQQQQQGAKEGQQQQQVAMDQAGNQMARPTIQRVFVAMKLKGGRLIARVCIDMPSGQVVSYTQPLCSDTEKWRYNRWTNWANVNTSSSSSSSSGDSSGSQGNGPDVYYPSLIAHQLHGDQYHIYETHGVVVHGAEIHRAYQMPASPRVPIDAQYLHRYSERVPIWQTAGGHILAECHINGKKAGWMVLDTGASGMVIEPTVAEQYGLPKFGNLNIAGVAGKVGTRFRRVSQLRIGPLLLSDPVMMEMNISKLVNNFHDRVVGIAGFDVFRRCRVTLPCHRTRMDLIKATGQYGKVQPWTEGSMPIPADRDSDLQLTPSQRWWEFNQYQMALQNAAAVVHAAEGGHSAAPRMPGQAVVSAVTVQQQKPTGRRRRKGTYSSTALQAAIGTSLVGADQVQQQQLLLDPQQQQQQQRDVGVQARVPRVPRKYFFWPNILIEMLLQRPDVKGAEEGYIWQQMIMIASLPHVELEFVVPRSNQRHRSLFMLDTGAGGTELMFHSRAAKELGLLVSNKKGGARTVTGVNAGGVLVQEGRLPEVVIHGQCGAQPNTTGSIVLTDVSALFSRLGGLDISLYAAGMICAGFLHRTQTVIDYTNKRIGWRIPPKELLEEWEEEQNKPAVSAASQR